MFARVVFFFNVVFTLAAVVAKKILGESAVRRDLRIHSNNSDKH